MALKGLRNFVVVEIEKDDETGTVYAEETKRLIGARNISMSPQLAEGALYGDDQLLESESSVSSIEVGFELASLSLEDEAFLSGNKFENGILKENKDATPPEIAFGFVAPKSKTGGGGFRMVWLLKGTAKPTDEEIATKEDSIEFQTPTLDYVFMPRLSDGEFRFKADTKEEGAPTPEQFFTSAFLKEGEIGV